METGKNSKQKNMEDQYMELWRTTETIMAFQ